MAFDGKDKGNSGAALPPPYDQPKRCQWNHATKRCWLPGGVSNQTVGSVVNGRTVPEPGYCAYHFAVLSAQAVDSWQGFQEWHEYYLEGVARYARDCWSRYTDVALYAALIGADRLPKVDAEPKRQRQLPPEAIKEYLEVIRRMVAKSAENPGDGSWGKEAKAYLHNKWPNPDCTEHPGCRDAAA